MKVEPLTAQYQYTYFISYHWNGKNQNGFGNAEVKRFQEIKSFDDLAGIRTSIIDNIIAENKLTPIQLDITLVILNYQLLNKTLIR